MADLEQYVAEVRSRSEAPIEPIPEIRQPEIYAYQSRVAGIRDPFTPAVEQDEPTAANDSGIQLLAHWFLPQIRTLSIALNPWHGPYCAVRATHRQLTEKGQR